MAVESVQAHVPKIPGSLDEISGLSCVDRDAELGVDPAGIDLFLGMGVDAYRDPQQDVLDDPLLTGDPVQSLQLIVVVHDEPSYVIVDGIVDVPVGLGRAVIIEICRIKAPGQGGVDLSRRNDVGAETLGLDDGIKTFEAEGLACVEGTGPLGQVLAHRFGIGPAVSPDLVFIHNVERISVLLRQSHCVLSADGQVAFLVDPKVIV